MSQQDLDAEAVRVILDQQGGDWPLTTRARIRQAPTWAPDVDDVVAALGSFDYFAPWGFAAPDRCRKAANQDGTIVFLDLDPPRGKQGAPAERWVDKRIAWFDAKLVPASVVIHSGRGAWLYWKLASPIEVDVFHGLTKTLARVGGGGDTASWGCERWARLPGSVNEKTGRLAHVMRVVDDRYQPFEFQAAVQALAQAEGIATAHWSTHGAGEDVGLAAHGEIQASDHVPEVELPARLRAYVESNPDWHEAQARGIDRSALDMSIVVYLHRVGAGDEEVKAWFEHYRPARYESEVRRGRGDRYLLDMLRKVQASDRTRHQAKDHQTEASAGGQICVYTESDPDRHDEDDQRPAGRNIPRLILKVVAANEGLTVGEMVRAIMEQVHLSDTTAKRRLRQLKDTYRSPLEYRPVDGRSQKVYLNERGRELVASGRRFVVKPMRVNKKPPPRQSDEALARPAPPPVAKPQDNVKVTSTSPRAQHRRVVEQLRWHQFDGVPRISWDGRQFTRFIQILDDLDEVGSHGTHLYDQIYVPPLNRAPDPYRPIFRTFATTRNPVYTSEPRWDPIYANTRHLPHHVFVAVAAEVEKTEDGYKLADATILDEHSGEARTVPAIGMIAEPSEFWRQLLDNPEVYNGQIVRSVRRGKRQGNTRTWSHSLTNTSIDLDPGTIGDHTARGMISYWRDRDRMRAYLGAMPEEWPTTYLHPEDEPYVRRSRRPPADEARARLSRLADTLSTVSGHHHVRSEV